MKEKKSPYGKCILFDSARARLWRLNQSWTAAIVGSLGSGKSWAALTIADYIMSGTFDPERLVFFRVKDFISAVREGRVKRGDCAIMDEAGISFSSRESMTKKNRSLSAIFQIMRFKNFGLILTVPSLKLVDVAGRDILNAVLETGHINRKMGYCTCRYKICQHNATLGTTYRKYVRMWKDGQKVRIPTVQVTKPRQELIIQYEKMKRSYAEGKDGLFAEIDELLNPTTPSNVPIRAGKPVTCKKCGHSWQYTGNMRRTRCNSCSSYVVVV